jgi:hypothetical protein
VRLQVSRRRLFDVLNAIESLFSLLFHLPEEFQDEADIRTILVEVEAVEPFVYAAFLLSLGRYPIDSYSAVNVARQILAVQLDLDANETVVLNPLRQRFRKAVVEAVLEVGVGYGVSSSYRMEQRRARRRLPLHVLLQVLSGKLAPKIAREIVIEEVRGVGGIAVQAVEFAECIVDGGIERAGGHLGTEFGNRRIQLQLPGNFFGGLQVLRFQLAVYFNRMPPYFTGGGNFRDTVGQGFHGPERGVIRHGFRGKSPDVAERHGSESLCRAAIPCMDGAADIQDRGAIDASAAELVGRAVTELFVIVRDFIDDDVSGLRRTPHGETERSCAA